jgi:hypothetical protein
VREEQPVILSTMNVSLEKVDRSASTLLREVWVKAALQGNSPKLTTGDIEIKCKT